MPNAIRLCCASLVLLAAAPPPATVRTGRRSAPAPSAARDSTARAYEVERDASHLLVVTRRTGLLSFLGHDHAILARNWDATLCLTDPPGPGSSGALTIPTARLAMDSDSARALARLGKGPSAADERHIRHTMLDAHHLDAAGHPEIRLRTTAVRERRPDELEVQARLTIRGVSRDVRFPVAVRELGAGRVRLSGILVIRQTDFGIHPESVAGVVKVADRVDLRFLIVALPSGRACVPQPAASMSATSAGDASTPTKNSPNSP